MRSSGRLDTCIETARNEPVCLAIYGSTRAGLAGLFFCSERLCIGRLREGRLSQSRSSRRTSRTRVVLSRRSRTRRTGTAHEVRVFRRRFQFRYGRIPNHRSETAWLSNDHATSTIAAPARVATVVAISFGETLHLWAVFHSPLAREIQKPTRAISHHITLNPMHNIYIFMLFCGMTISDIDYSQVSCLIITTG